MKNMRYYLIDKEGNLATIISEDARREFLALGERLRTGRSKKEVINGKMYVRALGVVCSS